MKIFEDKSNYSSSDYRSRNYSGNWVNQFINNYIDSLHELGLTKTQKEFSNYKDEHLPQSLYKFFPPTLYSLINLQNQTIFLSSPQNFNDPFDSYVCIETETYAKLYLLRELKKINCITKQETPDSLSEKEYWEIRKSWSKEEEMPAMAMFRNLNLRSTFAALYQILERKNKDFQKLAMGFYYKGRRECTDKAIFLRNLKFKISCFSNFHNIEELMQNTTMWSHYADNHKGFCIKYSLDFNKLASKDIISCGLFPVKYTRSVPKISPNELLKLSLKNNELHLNKKILKTTLKTLTTKSIFWSYEKEWRLILSDQNSMIFPNNLLDFCNIEAVFLGCKIENNLKREIIKLALLKGFRVFQTSQSNEKFILNYKLEELNKEQYDEYMKTLIGISTIEDPDLQFYLREKLNM